jgi:hypothetical protein
VDFWGDRLDFLGMKTTPVSAKQIVGPARHGVITDASCFLTTPFPLGKCKEFPSIDDDFKTLKNNF